MQIGCGVTTKAIRGRPYLYFWHYEERGGRRVQVFRYLGALRSDAARQKLETALDAYMDRHRLDAVLFPGAAGAAIAAKAGYPSVQVPAGLVSGFAGKETPDYPLGATFAGRAWSEATLLRLAYAFEQASHARRMPAGRISRCRHLRRPGI